MERSRLFWNVRDSAAEARPPRKTTAHAIGSCSVVVTSAPAVLSGEVDLRMHDTHVACQCVVARKSFLLDTECAAYLLLARIVYRVLVTGEVIGTRKYGVARLAGRGVDALTLVGSRLRIALQNSRRRHSLAEIGTSMTLTLMLLQLLRSFETLRAAMVRARVRARVST